MRQGKTFGDNSTPSCPLFLTTFAAVMSQEYYPSDGPSRKRITSPRPSSFIRSATGPPSKLSQRPHYVTVGQGSTSASAGALVAALDNDSGYGGSISTDGYTNDGDINGWLPGVTEDRPTPSHTPILPSEYNNPAADSERRILAAHVHQLYFNQNRVALGRVITQTVATLKDLQQMNSTWPAQYPSTGSRTPLDQRPDSIPYLSRQWTGELQNQSQRPGPRRAATSLHQTTAESSSAAESRNTSESARLITPQVEHQFSVLKLELKVQGLNQTDIVHSMEKKSIASLLDGKINQSVRHLLSLRDRIEDTSSKVLVTGDVNAGKSTFCNALLRRKILPEDQQPCTNIFCEVLDARENGGIEEAHAVHKDTLYDRNDESTYDVYPLYELEKVVTESQLYTQCKVYIKDIRTIDQSLLNNGVVDISIIDAPGLNIDSVRTTAVFTRQEEIDVVVFVVSAANHLTQSAQDFITDAAREKAYIFIVVNGYDNIKDKQKCQDRILRQVALLSPRTFKESTELVHFVSSNAIPVAPASSLGPGASGDGDGGGSDPSDDSPPMDDEEILGKHGEPGSPPGKGKGKEKENIEDFERLESALRRFVLEKRARSKLAPAKTYLLNILSDLNILATVNRDIAQSELDRVSRELEDLEPVYEQSKKARAEVSDDVDKTVEETCNNIYSHTRNSLNNAIAHVADADLGVPYSSIFNIIQYAEDIKAAILDRISITVAECEDHARSLAESGINTINQLGILHLGDKYSNLTFLPEKMFHHKRDKVARQVSLEIEFWDFFDLWGIWERQEKVAGTGMAMTVVGVVGGRMIGGVGWIDGALGAARVLGTQNLRNLIVPGILASGAYIAPPFSYFFHLLRLAPFTSTLTFPNRHPNSSLPTLFDSNFPSVPLVKTHCPYALHHRL